MADRVPLDFDPAARQLRALLYGITDDRLGRPTPCPDWTVADLLDHLTGLCRAFTQAARKANSDEREPSGANLPVHWRSRLPVLIEDLATAWKDPAAWTGTATVGGTTLPAADVGLIAMNELTVHSWDLARATGQDFAADPRNLGPLIEFLARTSTPPGDTDERSLLDRAVALSGRDPGWRRPSARSSPAAG